MEASLKLVHSIPKRENERERERKSNIASQIKSTSLAIEKETINSVGIEQYFSYLTSFCSFKQLLAQVKWCLNLLYRSRHIQLLFHTGVIEKYEIIAILQNSQCLLVMILI
jgi:hypothetical protein